MKLLRHLIPFMNEITVNKRTCCTVCTGKAWPLSHFTRMRTDHPGPHSPVLPTPLQLPRSAKPSQARRQNKASFPLTRSSGAPFRRRYPAARFQAMLPLPGILGLGPAAGPTIPGSPCPRVRVSAGGYPGRAAQSGCGRGECPTQGAWRRRGVGGACARRGPASSGAGGRGGTWGGVCAGLGGMGGAWGRRAAHSGGNGRSGPGGWRGVGEAGFAAVSWLCSRLAAKPSVPGRGFLV